MEQVRRVALGGVEFDDLSMSEVVARVSGHWRTSEGGWIVTVNVDILRRLTRDPGFVRLTEHATLRVADGMPILWASRLAGKSLTERVAGADLLWALSAAAAGEGRRVFLVGGAPGAADGASRAIRDRYPTLQIVGTETPPMGFEADEAYVGRLETLLAEAKPDLVFVALGCPKQDRLIARLRRRLPAAWFVGVGIAFSFAAGDVRRAPAMLQNHGLEWAYRLAQEPRRLLRRYVVDDLPFALKLMAAASGERLTAGVGRSRASQLTVLHLGPDIHESGGMGKVIAGYRDADLRPWSVQALSTYSHRSRRAMLGRFAAATFHVAFRPKSLTVGLHVHVSERFDLFRNLLFVRIARMRRIPVVATIHGADFVSSAERWPSITRALLRRVSVLTVLSTEVRQTAEALGARRVVLVPNSVEVPALGNRRSAALTSSRVLFASEIGRRKGVDVLLRAWPLVHSARPEAELVLMGPVVDHGLVEDLPDGVVLTGPKRREDVRAEIDRSAIAILPSRAEAMPMFILEAMAAGVPVITTSVGGIEELVGDAVKLVPVGDVHATAQAVVDLLERPDCIEELGRRGRELVRRSYSDDVVFRRLRALYEEAFSNGAESARDIEVRARP